MKKFLMILVLVVMLVALIVPMSMAEAVDAAPAESASPDLTQLLTKEVLARRALGLQKSPDK